MRHELTLVTTDDIEKAIDTPPTTDVNPSAREPRGLAGLDALLSYVSKTCLDFHTSTAAGKASSLNPKKWKPPYFN